jgi:hypothetical protein
VDINVLSACSDAWRRGKITVRGNRGLIVDPTARASRRSFVRSALARSPNAIPWCKGVFMVAPVVAITYYFGTDIFFIKR